MSYSQIIQGSFTSGGTAYDLQLPIETVQGSTQANMTLVRFEIFNYTKWATNTQNLSAQWFKGMPNASALITSRGTTDLSSVLETTNGLTIVNDTPLYGVEITAISNANPGVATFRGPGLTPGQGISNWSTGDKGIFRGVSGSNAWNAINGVEYTITKVTAQTFSFAVDTSAFGTYTASSGIFYRTTDAAGRPIPPLNVANVGVRLGTAIVGNDGDVMYWQATICDDTRALGDIGA